MTSKLFLILMTCFMVSYASGQEKIWTKQAKLSEVLAFEKQINDQPKVLSQNVSVTKNFYPLADKYEVTLPLIIQRDAVGYLPLYAEYFYTPEDSIVRLISYDWEKDKYGNFFNKQQTWKAESKNFKQYNSEYERIKNILLDQLQIPVSTDEKAKKVSGERSTYYTRETVWETEELHASLFMIFESMTYRIRLTLYWKK